MRLSENQAGAGTVAWIGIRPERRAPLVAVDAVEAIADVGLEGDHYAGRPGSDRQVTLFQYEHLDVIASFMKRSSIQPDLLRRNIAVRGINLLSLVGRRFRVGGAVLEGAGPCRPCSRMEENLGHGAWNAMRGHGGITARVVQSGSIRVGDAVADLAAAETGSDTQSDDNS